MKYKKKIRTRGVKKVKTIRQWCKRMDRGHGYYTVNNPDEEEKLENLWIELCVERFLAEGIDLTGWYIAEHPYGDDDVEYYSFINDEQEQFVDFEIQKDDVYEGKGYIAVPMYNHFCDGPIRLIKTNTVKGAIQSFDDIEE